MSMKKQKNKKQEAAGNSQPAPPAFPQLDAAEACASLRSFVRCFVVPGVDGSSLTNSTTTFGGISLDELTLRARGAERALAVGAKAAQRVV